MRLDLVSIDIFGSDSYVEELMHMNNIIDPYSIKNGDIIYYPVKKDKIEVIQKPYKKEEDVYGNPDSSSPLSRSLPMSTPSSNYKQIRVDDKNKKIKVTNKLD